MIETSPSSLVPLFVNIMDDTVYIIGEPYLFKKKRFQGFVKGEELCLYSNFFGWL